MKHIKLFRLFESELSENKVDITNLFTSEKWLSLCEALGIKREEMKDKEVRADQKEGFEQGVNTILPSDGMMNAVKLTHHDPATLGRNPVLALPGNSDFEYFKNFIVKPLRSYEKNSPAKLLLDETLVFVSGRNRENLSIRILSKDPRRDIGKDLKKKDEAGNVLRPGAGGFRTGVRFSQDISSKTPEEVDGIVADALINISIKSNRDYFEAENKNNPQSVDQFNLFCDIISGMIANACERPELGPGEERKKEIYDIILGSSDYRVMNFVKKYYPDLWDEIQTATGGGAETISDLTELGF